MAYCHESIHDRIAMIPPTRLITPERREDDRLEASIRPQNLTDFVGQEQARANLKVSSTRANARRSARPRAVRRARRGSARRRSPRSSRASSASISARPPGPVIAKAGDLAAHPHQSRAARRPVHRRDPSAQSGGRGNSLSRDGGFPARPRDRRGAGGALGEDRSRRNSRSSARRHARACSRRRLRDRFGIPIRLNFYTVEELESIVKPRRACHGLRHLERRRAMRSPDARAARRASRGGCCGACAISPSSNARPSITRELADSALTLLEVDAHRPRPDGPALSGDDRGGLRRRAGRHRDHRGRARPSRATRSRTLSSPI